MGVLFVGIYGAAYKWAAYTGVSLGLDLLPSGFRSPTPTWPFTLVSGILAATAILLLLNLRSQPLRTTAIRTAAIVALAGFLAAIVTIYFVDDLVQDQSGWQRICTFMSQSEAVVVFTAIMSLVASASLARREASSGAEELNKSQTASV